MGINKTAFKSESIAKRHIRMLSPIINHQAVYNNQSVSQISDKNLGYPYNIPPPAPFFGGGLGNQTQCGIASSSINNVTSMKAIRVHRFGGPDVLEGESNVSVPELNPDQVLVRVVYAGVNPVETYIREGQYSRLPELPYTPGSDAAGYVHQVGSNVTNIKVGERVFVSGTNNNSGSYAEFIVSDSTYVFPLHPRLSFAQGASLGVPFFTAYKALILRAKTKPGETVLVHGAIVVGTAGTKEGMDVVTKCGAHHVFNHNHKNYDKKIVEHLGSGFDVIIEHLANINLGHDIQMIKEGARVMIVGCRGAVSINPRHLMLPEASIQGVALGSTSPAQWAEMGAAIVAGIEAGWVNPVINKEYNMEEAAQVHHDIIHSKGAKGKLVLKVSSEE